MLERADRPMGGWEQGARAMCKIQASFCKKKKLFVKASFSNPNAAEFRLRTGKMEELVLSIRKHKGLKLQMPLLADYLDKL